MSEFHRCDLCGLHRSTLHIDDVVDSETQVTAHLCDDCWYRLGIRIPLGNIWKHIGKFKEESLAPPPPPPAGDEPDISEEDLNDLLDTSPLAVAEPEDEPITEELEIVVDFLKAGDLEAPPEITERSLPEDLTDSEPEKTRRHGLESFRIGHLHASLVSIIPMEMLMRCKAIPVRLEGASLTVAVANPFDSQTIGSLEMFLEQLEMRMTLAFADEKEILQELKRHSGPHNRFTSLM